MSCFSLPQIYEEFYHTVNNADHEKDLKWWSNNHGVNMAMNWPQFEVCYQTYFSLPCSLHQLSLLLFLRLSSQLHPSRFTHSLGLHKNVFECHQLMSLLRCHDSICSVRNLIFKKNTAELTKPNVATTRVIWSTNIFN